MGDYRNKLPKILADQRRHEAEHRTRNGWTVFHFDFKPSLTRRNMTVGEAVRYLMRETGTRISFWRCPVRGLAVQYKQLPRTSFAHDSGETWKFLTFSPNPDVTRAKHTLVVDVLLSGIGLYRGLPNQKFHEEAERIRWLLTAPPSVSAKDWKASLAKLDVRVQPLLRTHEAELRFHLLGEKYAGPIGTVAVSARIRVDALDSRPTGLVP